MVMGSKNLKTNLFWINITSKCNNNCNFCYYIKRNRNIRISDLENLVRLIRRINLCAKIVLLGGEPTIHPKFSKVLSILDFYGFRPGIVTNGFAFRKIAFCKKYITNFEDISISIHGDKETHDKLTNNPRSFDYAIKAIKNIKSLNYNNLTTTTVVNKLNIKKIINLVDLLSELGITEFHFNNYIGSNKFGYSTKKFINQFTPILLELSKKYKKSRFFITTPIDNKLVSKNIKKFVKSTCTIISKDGLVIDSDGSVYICPHRCFNPLGDIKNIKTIANYQNLINSSYPKRCRIVDCHNCKI